MHYTQLGNSGLTVSRMALGTMTFGHYSFATFHANVDQERWVAEFSQYDAGWLHFFKSANDGDIRRSNWDDLNYPARLSTLVAAGLPVLQRDNHDALVATDALARGLDIGVFFSNMAELREHLRDDARMAELRDNVWRRREQFTFDYHADRLIDFFRRDIKKRHE